MPYQPRPILDRKIADDYHELQAILLIAGGQGDVAEKLLTDPTMADQFDAFLAKWAPPSPEHAPHGLLHAAEAFKRQHGLGLGGEGMGTGR